MTPKGLTCVFIVYDVNQKGYKLDNLKDKSVFVSRYVMFYENHFPLKGYAVVEQPLFVDNVKVYLDDQDNILSNEHQQLGVDNIDNINIQPNHQPSEPIIVEDVDLRRSTRVRGPLIWHRDYAMSGSGSNARYPISDCVNYSHFQMSVSVF